MKLVRFGPDGAERPGLIDSDGILHDLSAEVDEIDGRTVSHAGLSRIAGLDAKTLPAVEGEPRLGAPVAGIGKIVGSGLNYKSFAAAASSAS